MNEFDLERYRNAWQSSPAFGGGPLGPNEINAVLEKQSKSVTQQFRVGLLTDIVLKGLASLALVGLLYLYRGNAVVTWLNAAVLGFTLFLLFAQCMTLKKVPRPERAGDDLRNCLQGMIRFYRTEFTRALYVAAVSGSLVFYTGVLYYGWFRYGGIRPMQADDYVVFVTGLLLAFAINAAAQRWQAGFHVRELELCLQDLDDDSLTEQRVRQRRFKRIKISLMWLVWAVLGVLVLAWFIAR